MATSIVNKVSILNNEKENVKRLTNTEGSISLDEKFGLVGLVHEKEEFQKNQHNKRFEQNQQNQNNRSIDSKLTNQNNYYHKTHYLNK